MIIKASSIQSTEIIAVESGGSNSLQWQWRCIWGRWSYPITQIVTSLDRTFESEKDGSFDRLDLACCTIGFILYTVMESITNQFKLTTNSVIDTAFTSISLIFSSCLVLSQKQHQYIDQTMQRKNTLRDSFFLLQLVALQRNNI